MNQVGSFQTIPEEVGMQSPTVDKTVSFRSQISGEINDFLEREGMQCAETAGALVMLVAELAHYKEEGIQLTPEVLICNDISKIEALLQGPEIIKIGSGPRASATFLKALKECAPLAKTNWIIFVERCDTEFKYGVICSSNNPLTLTPFEVLIEEGDESMPVIFAMQIAENCVEVIGSRGNRCCLHFSAAKEETPSPKLNIENLSKAITGDVPQEYSAEAFRYIYKTIKRSLQECHGALIVVLGARKKTIPKRLSGRAIVLDSPLEIGKAIQDYSKHKDIESISRLQNLSNIISGMISCDGIVLFRSDAALMGYRAFITITGKSKNQQGGARRLTFETLKGLVGKDLIAAFIRSQDGHTEFLGHE